MKQRRPAIMFLIVTLSAGAFASGSSNDLKPLAIQVSEAAKQITKDAGNVKSAANPVTARRDLHIRIAKLKELAEPLGAAFDKPYGQCGVMALNLDGFVDASVGAATESKFYFDSYRTSERECQSQINGAGSQPDDNLAILDL